MSNGNEVLTISDVTFMVTSQIQRAPHWTMIRELTMNAIEAAARASGEKTVHWTSALHHGVRKAMIWNTGPGMDAAELKLATDLACQVNKNLGLDENFGVGAKVSSLANNKCGMRFRSCKDGKISEVILGYDEEQAAFVRFTRNLPGGKTDTVIDVTKAAASAGAKTNFDWTEVMLLGNSEDQDTAEKPFAAQPVEKAYIANALYRRFYRLPPGVKVRLDSIYHRFDTTRPFAPVGARYDKFKRTETVAVPELGLQIHFLHDPAVEDRSGLRQSSRGALGSTTTTCCLIHKDEMYSVMTGNEWSAAAPRFGIPFGSKELCVHIELSAEHARPSQYRERLISPDSGEDILTEDFTFTVRERMPAWVLEVIKNASPRRTEDFTDIESELQELLNKYKVRVEGRRSDPGGVQSAEPEGQTGTFLSGGAGAGPGGGNGASRRNTNRRILEVPEGATTTSLYEVYEKAPKIIMLEESEQIQEKGLKGRAAVFILETGDLFINGLYEAVDQTYQDVVPTFAGQADDETIRTVATNASRHALALRVGKAVVYALAKRARDDWSEIDLRSALSKECLSISADNYEESISAVKRQITRELKVAKVAA